VNHWPSGMNGTSWNACNWIRRARPCCAARSGAFSQSSRSASIRWLLGQPGAAAYPLPRRKTWPTGLIRSIPLQEVWYTLHPPRSTASVLVRRCTSVDQSLTW